MTNADNRWRVYVVGFLDVLGQSEGLMRLEKMLDEGSPPRRDLTQEESKFSRQVEGVRQTLYNVKTLLDARMELNDSPCPAEDRDVRFRIQAFSDTVLFCSPLCTQNGQLLLQHVNAILNTVAVTMVGAFSQGLPLRGAIEQSYGVELDQSDLYGPVMAQVHHLESEVAKHPRIVIGERLYGLLRRQADGGDQTAMDCIALVDLDGDGVPHLDFLCESLSRKFASAQMADGVTWAQAVQKGWEFVSESRARFVQMKDQKLAQRYWMLEEYFRSRAPAWGARLP